NTETSLVRRAVESGAAGYVTKAATAAQLVDALERIHAGEQVLLLGEVDAIDSDTLLGRWPGDLLGLSPREGEILALICQGLTNEDITTRAYIGMNTVKTHIRSLYRKIGATTRSQAVRWGIERGFAPDRHRVVLDAPGESSPHP
ncbi:response regulator transcription factor, partial [Nocardioides sp.]|uniref:response regulator transcription factor n=1 Tax=Nocardioides sp. TaxID=35761 RepID=UPI002B26EB32